MDIVDRINSCQSFAEGKCRHQQLMERLYLIYQIFETEQLLRAKALCHQCGECSSPMSVASGPPNRSTCSKNTRLLIVDDHHQMRETIRSFLEGLPGFEVVGEAENGRVAVQLAREKKPAVVVMDVIMPEMDGIEATRLITTEMPEIKVIALSMHCNEGYGETLHQAGASRFVSKDSAFQELIPAIEAVIANASE